MDLTGNTILITGGGSGIGRGLAERLHALGNQVIIAGRRASLLRDVCAANPGMACVEIDVTDATGVHDAVSYLLAEHPALNVLINGAGVQTPEGIAGATVDDAMVAATFAANMFGPVRLCNALVPHFLAHRRATIINVTSMLGDLPIASLSAYCASKAALHSWTLSLRYKLRDTSVTVRELAPPYVQTPLLNAASDPRAMPLEQFLDQTMTALASDDFEILVPVAKARRVALRNDELGAMVRLNEFIGEL